MEDNQHKKLIRVDMHVHTKYSRDSSNDLDDILSAVNSGKLDKIFITDHNTIKGAVKLSRQFPQKILVGEEVNTDCGEIILYFVREEIPSGLDLIETIKIAREQNCLISVPHPLDRFRSSAIGPDNLNRILNLIDGIEIFNSRCLWAGDNARALTIAQKNKLLFTAGSDAHVRREIGRAGIICEDFYDTPSLKLSLINASYFGILSHPAIHLYSTVIKAKKDIT
ncbi:MAG: hypothetical protein APR63_12515 [Desulfuromonas sp. SDB]|nr:MAG: hypothetical protein APR63_12515 [Desulfuromonas sp. SDB]